MIEIWSQVGDLEKRGEHLEQEFKLDPRVSERTDTDTFAVCKAVQVHPTIMTLFFDYHNVLQEVKGTLAGGDDAYKGAPAQEQMNIFYPPQVRIFTSTDKSRF